MPLTPLDITKARFGQKLRGYDSQEVDDFLAEVAEELATRLSEVDRLQRECRYYRQRLENTEEREHQLQQTLLRAQKVSEEITAAAQREAELVVKEAEITGDRIVGQAVDQAAQLEEKIKELRLVRRELLTKVRNDLAHFQATLELLAEEAAGPQGASIHSLSRNRQDA